MIKVTIDEGMALDMLMERVEHWTEDSDVIRLYEQMYEQYIDCGAFECSEFDVMAIVDNDYINYCDVVEEGDDDYDEIKSLYDENGCTDISCETNGRYGFIEAEYNGLFLIRY